MAIKHELSVPEDLPASYLYLDEIEDVLEILAQAQSALPEGRRGAIKFKVGNIECDTLEDLKRLGGTKKELRIGSYPAGVTIHSTFSTTAFSGLEGDAEWAAFAKIYAVFKRRPRWVKNLFEQFPTFYGIVFFSALSALGPLSMIFSHDEPHSQASAKSVIAAVAVAVPLVALLYRLVFIHSIVYLRYSHEGPGIAERMRTWAPVLVPFVILGLQQLIQHYHP